MAKLSAEDAIPAPPLSGHLVDGSQADLKVLGQFLSAHSLRPLHPEVLSFLLGETGPPSGEPVFGPRLRLCRDRAFPVALTGGQFRSGHCG